MQVVLPHPKKQELDVVVFLDDSQVRAACCACRARCAVVAHPRGRWCSWLTCRCVLCVQFEEDVLAMRLPRTVSNDSSRNRRVCRWHNCMEQPPTAAANFILFLQAAPTEEEAEQRAAVAALHRVQVGRAESGGAEAAVCFG